MILVNDPGSWQYVYAPLRHAEWNGCTPTDLVFPFFLFMVGIAISIALGKRMDSGVDTKGLINKIVKRSIIIFSDRTAAQRIPWLRSIDHQDPRSTTANRYSIPYMFTDFHQDYLGGSTALGRVTAGNLLVHDEFHPGARNRRTKPGAHHQFRSLAG